MPGSDGTGPAAVLTFAGQAFAPLPSGALYWPAEAALIVADLHFEKFSSFAKNGRMLPPYDSAATLSRLEADLAAWPARRVIALGDSFHRDEGAETLPPTERARLSALTARHDWLWLAGNHDPAPHELGGTCAATYRCAGIDFVHAPRPGGVPTIAGHLHPAARIAGDGTTARRRCFVSDGRLLILPAYGASTGSLNILGLAFAGLFDPRTLEVIMLGRNRIYRVSPKRLVVSA